MKFGVVDMRDQIPIVLTLIFWTVNKSVITVSK